MALLSINPFKKERQPSTLEKIAMGVGIAKDVMGAAIAIPSFLQQREEFKSNKAFRALQEGQIRSDIGEKTETAQVGEEGAFEVPGMGLRKPSPSLQRQIQEIGLAEKVRLGQPAKDADYDLLMKAMPGVPLDSLKNQFKTLGEVNEATNRILGATTVKIEQPNKPSVSSFAKDFTKTSKDDPSATKIQLDTGEVVYGKPKKELTQPTIQTLDEGKAIPNQLVGIRSLIRDKKELFDPIKGRIRGANPYDKEAQVANAQLRATSQAFGRYMEGGVLRKEDEEKYRKMFPQISDSEEVANGKLDVVDNMLKARQKSLVKSFKEQGYNVAGFEENEKESIKGDIDNDGQISEAEAWIMKNPDDPRVSEVIKSINTRKGLNK